MGGGLCLLKARLDEAGKEKGGHVVDWWIGDGRSGLRRKERKTEKIKRNRVRIGERVSWDSGFWEIWSAWGRVRENWEEEFESHGEAVSKRSYREVISSWAEEELLVLVQVFSMLDTQSLCYNAATCTMFHKCAMDPLCYATIDLTIIVPKVNNAAVFTMTQWAGKVLR